MELKLSVESRGTGAPLLLLHGFSGSRASWEPVRPLLAKSRQLLTVDLPGHGESPLPSAPDGAGFLETVDALARLIEGLGLGATDILGYSMGARVALALAVRHPDRVRRLVLESGSPGLMTRTERLEREAADELLAQSLERGGMAPFVAEWEALPLFSGVRRLPSEVQERVRAQRLGNHPQRLAAALRVLGTGTQPSLWHALQAVRAPVLLLVGSDDAKFVRTAEQMAAELPVVWTRRFEGCGHVPHLEAPLAWANEVNGFLRTPWYEGQVDIEELST